MVNNCRLDTTVELNYVASIKTNLVVNAVKIFTPEKIPKDD